MADTSKNSSGAYVREIELRGHILDSGVFGHVLEVIMDNEYARYTIDNFSVGQTATEPSTARLRIEADSAEHLGDLLDKLRDIGAILPDDTDVRTERAPRDGVLPDDFYATTNLETEVRVAGSWVPVALPEMDCSIVVRGESAATVAPSDVRAGDEVVVGHAGVRVQALQRPRRKQVFEFMSSAVSSEKPKESLIAEVARELLATRAAGKRVLLVGGPAIVHTGAGKYLEWLIREGFVNALFAGNALAAHDIESQFFGTSLGVDLDDAFPVEEGHVHHLRAINRIRRRRRHPARNRERAAARRNHVRGLSAQHPGRVGRFDSRRRPAARRHRRRRRGATGDAPSRAGDRHGAMRLHAAPLDRRRQFAARIVQGHLRRHQSRQRHEVNRSRLDPIDRPRHGRGLVSARDLDGGR